jgi:hypothetical protein
VDAANFEHPKALPSAGMKGLGIQELIPAASVMFVT